MENQTRRDFLRNSTLAGGALMLGAAAPVSEATNAAVAASGATDVVSATAAGRGGLLQLARVWVDADTAHLLGTFDDTHHVFDDGSVELLLWPGDLARLEATGLRFRITESDLAARDAELAEGAVRPADLPRMPGETDGEYRLLADYNAEMQQLAADHPDICELITLPVKSLQGRTIYGLEIAEDVARKDGRPVFYNDGIHHAREWPAAEVPIMWAYDLIECYRRATTLGAELQEHDLRMANIVRNTRNVIIPIVNVDGFDYSRTGPAGTGRTVDTSLTGLVPGASMQYWRKNMRGAQADRSVPAVNPGVEHQIPQNGVLPTTPGALGVDPNRNYSYRWGGNGSSATLIDETYRGVEPFSEPEPQNVQWAHRTYQCVAGVTHHTSGDLVLWAWGDTHDDAPDDALLARVGFACGDFNKYRPTKSIDLYVTTGTCSDYTYGTFGSISYTFEHAGSSFHPPYPTTVPPMYAKNREALMLLCELVCLEPDQRGFMHAAIDRFGPPRRGPYTLKDHLTGSFVETITGTVYEYPASNGLDLNARFNCVITGQVTRDGVPVKATITNTKTFDNALTPGNPIGEETWPEEWRSTIETDDDGRFRWVVYPSTRPAVEFAGGQDLITISAEGADGGAWSQDIAIRRGEVHDFGTIELT